MKSNSPIWQYVRWQFIFEAQPVPEDQEQAGEVDGCSSAPLLTTALGMEPWPVTTITSFLNFE